MFWRLVLHWIEDHLMSQMLVPCFFLQRPCLTYNTGISFFLQLFQRKNQSIFYKKRNISTNLVAMKMLLSPVIQANRIQLRNFYLIKSLHGDSNQIYTHLKLFPYLRYISIGGSRGADRATTSPLADLIFLGIGI